MINDIFNYNSNPYALSRLSREQVIEKLDSRIKPHCIQRNVSKLALVCSVWLQVSTKEFLEILIKLTKRIKCPKNLNMMVEFVRRHFLVADRLRIINSDFILNPADFGHRVNIQYREAKSMFYCIIQYFWAYVKSGGQLNALTKLIKNIDSRVSVKKQLEPEHIRNEYIEMYKLLITRTIIKPKECCICLEEIVNSMFVTACGHIFHKSCIDKCDTRVKECPVCRIEI